MTCPPIDDRTEWLETIDSQAVLVLGAGERDGLPADADGVTTLARASEQARRRAFPSTLERAADAYIVRRGLGRSVVLVIRGSQTGDATRSLPSADSASRPVASPKPKAF